MERVQFVVGASPSTNLSPLTISFLEQNFFPRKIGNHTFFTGEEYTRLEFRLESEPKQLQLKQSL